MSFSPAVKMLEAFKYPALSDILFTLHITYMDFMIFVVCAWVLSNLGSLEIRASSYIFAKLQKCTVPMHTVHCSFQLKWTLVAVKHQQLLFLFTQMMISEADYSLIMNISPQFVQWAWVGSVTNKSQCLHTQVLILCVNIFGE